MRALGARHARGRIDQPAGEQGDLEAELAQQAREEAVQLVTESAAPPDDELVVDRLELERQGPPGGDVEVLEGHCAQVGEAELGESLQRPFGPRREADPSEISVDVHWATVDSSAHTRANGHLAAPRPRRYRRANVSRVDRRRTGNRDPRLPRAAAH